MTADRGRKVASPPETPEIAISLAKAGWPVFPVTVYEDADGKRSKVPAVKWKEWATTDVKTVAKAWAGEHSGRWIGVYAGKAGIVVLDVDTSKDDSRNGFKALDDAALPVVPTAVNYRTPSGGKHFVYRAPEGADLTIARDLIVDGVPLKGVDVRSGAGLMVYYGPKLKRSDIRNLPPAPDWLIVERGESQRGGGTDRDPSATEERFRERLVDSKPRKKLAKLIRGVEFPAGAAHEPMLEVVAALVGEGVRGTAGVLRLLDETRERYVKGGADRARDWENAIAGSVKRFGLPPVTLALTEAEKKVIARRNDPAEIERRDAARKATFRVEKHSKAIAAASDPDADRPLPGDRVLEDASLADELAHLLRGRWTYADGYGLMRYVKVGKAGRWRPAEEHALIEAVRRLLVEIEVDEHAAAAMRGDNKAIDKARTLLARGRAAAVSRFIIGILAEDAPAFDAHPDLLNTPTGVVDLRTGELSKADPLLYLTKMTAAPYDPKADLTLWRKALEALPADVVPWLQVRFGQSATGHTPDDDVLLIFEGAGENGKTTILHGTRAALGEYAVTVSSKLLVGNPNDHPTTLMTLQGARQAVVEELPEGRNLNVKQMKDAVGTPEITARRMRQDEVTFRTTHSLMISTNYLPIVAETDHGTWRRLALVRFPCRFVKTKAEIKSPRDRLGDGRLKHAFDAGDPGVLRWIVEGAASWYASGQRMPKAPKRIKRDTRAWRMDADPILAYVAERLVRDEGYAITTADLAADFNLWLSRRGHHEWTQQTINSRFQGHVSMDGVERKQVGFGVKMRPSRSKAVLSSRPIPKITMSWRGVRFDDEMTIPSEAELDAATLADLERRASA